MLLIPYDKIEITTEKTPLQIHHVLTNTIACKGLHPLRFWNKKRIHGKLFEGYSSEDHFKLRRIICCWNVCLPIMSGKITPGDKTKVKVKFRLSVRDEIILLSFFIGFVITLATLFVPQFKSEFMFKVKISVIFALGVGVIMFLYKSEVYKTKKILIELIEKFHPHRQNTK